MINRFLVLLFSIVGLARATTQNITGTVPGMSITTSGTQGDPLILDFSAATVTGPLTVKGVSWVTILKPAFSSSASGSSRSNALIEFNQQQSDHVTIDGATYTGPNGGTRGFVQAQYVSNFVLENCRIDNVSGGVVSDSNSSHDWKIRNNYFRTSINTATQTDVVFIGDAYNITIEGNMLINRSPGQNNDGTHNDVIQTFHGGSGGAGDPSGWIIRYNWVGLQMETPKRTGDNSWLQLEHFSDAKGFGLKIYGNVFYGGEVQWSGNNGFGWSGAKNNAHAYVYNNTVIRKSGPDRTIGWIQGGTFYFRNNVGMANSGQSGTFIDIKAMTPGAPYDYNVFYRFLDATSAQAGPHGSTSADPKFEDYAGDKFWPGNGSPLIGKGDGGLGAEYNQGLAPGCQWPNPQLVTRTGAWDVGAYVSGGQPVSPTPSPAPTATPGPTATPTATPNPSATPLPSTKFKIGDLVATTAADASVRSSPAGTVIGTQALGAIGTVTGGPIWMPANPSVLDNTATHWWQVEFAQAPNGWLGEIVLEKATNSTPTPAPTATPSPTVTPPSGQTYDKWIQKQNDWTKANPPTPDK
jgi:hypothetical protein